MSKTDKTDPYWVKKYRYGDIEHNCHGKECVPEKFGSRSWRKSYQQGVTCFYRIPGRYAYQIALCGRGGKGYWEHANSRERAARNQTRMSLRQIQLTGDDEIDVVPTKHRHSAWWDWC